MDVDEDQHDEEEQRGAEDLPVVGDQGCHRHRDQPETEISQCTAPGYESQYSKPVERAKKGQYLRFRISCGMRTVALDIGLVTPDHCQVLERVERRHHKQPERVNS